MREAICLYGVNSCNKVNKGALRTFSWSYRDFTVFKHRNILTCGELTEFELVIINDSKNRVKSKGNWVLFELAGSSS